MTLEALAAGCPVVATDVGDVACIMNNHHGAVVPLAGNEEMIISNLDRALTHVLGRSWDAATVSSAVAGLTWERVAERYLQVMSC